MTAKRTLCLATGLLLLGACSDPSPGTPEGAPGEARATSPELAAAAASSVDHAVPDEAFVAAEPERVASRVPPSPSGTVRFVYSSVEVDIEGDVARTTVTDVFVNDRDSEVEMTYRFPLPADAAVTGFADFRDGERVEAAVGERQRARAAYEDAVARGEHAALGEQTGRSFAMDLSPIAPRASRRVELRYVQTIRPVGGERDYVFPAEHSNGYRPSVTEISATVRGGAPLLRIESPNHPDAQIRRGEHAAAVALSRAGAPLGEDVVVRWTERTEPLELMVRAERTSADPAEGYVEARFSFNEDALSEHRPPRDVVLVVDRSLSMAGPAIGRAVELATRVVESLGPRDRLALVTFNHELASWDALEPAGDAARRRALDQIAGLAPGGRSNLAAAVDRAAELVRGVEAPLVVLATDGQPTVGDDFETIPTGSRPEDFSASRVLVALFNYPAQEPTLDPLFGGATVHYVPAGEAGDETVDRLVALATAPVLEELEVEVEGAVDGTVHGALPGRLALGDRVRVTARTTGEVEVRVRGRLHGRAVAFEGRASLPDAVAASPVLPVEWARMRIAELERRFRETEDADERSRRRAEIIELGRERRLATMFTSFVARDTLGPDRILPGDPEIRIRAPRSALAVYGMLPWGEVIECSWREDEGLWYGRFLVPRETPDGLYRVRVLVRDQSETTLRSTLMFRVDSRPPRFELRAVVEGRFLQVTARALQDVFESRGDTLTPDLVDLRSLVVTVGGETVALRRVGAAVWQARIPLDGLAGPQTVELVATDFARNMSSTSTRLVLR